MHRSRALQAYDLIEFLDSKIKCNTISLFIQKKRGCMGDHYQHLSREERAVIIVRRRDGLSSRAIARELKRAPSTVSREMNAIAICQGVRTCRTKPPAPAPALT